jgi:hypothetical protein
MPGGAGGESEQSELLLIAFPNPNRSTQHEAQQLPHASTRKTRNNRYSIGSVTTHAH